MLGYDDDFAEEAFSEALARYLSDTLHAAIAVTAFIDQEQLPQFLTQTYRVLTSDIAGCPCVFLAASGKQATPREIAKHVALAERHCNTLVCFAAPALSAHNRSRLIAAGVPFAVPGNQLYIPQLAMDLREHFRRPRTDTSTALTPAAQAILFDRLLRGPQPVVTPSRIASRLNYHPMSVGRGFEDLAQAGLAQIQKVGREKHLEFVDGGFALFERASSRLISPVRTERLVTGRDDIHRLKIAGEDALSRYSDLGPPRLPVFAVPAKEWNSVARALSLAEAEKDMADCVIESWSYDPGALSDTPVADPLSIYAQFRDHPDPRLAGAAEAILETVRWL